MAERKPDTVVLSFNTVVDVVVDLQTKTFKTEFEGLDDISGGPFFATIWAEGELLDEVDFRSPLRMKDLNPDDRAALKKARELVQ